MSRLVAAALIGLAGLGVTPAAQAAPTSPFDLVVGDSYFRGNITWNSGSYIVSGKLHTEGCLSVRTTGYALRDGVPHQLNDSSTGPLCDVDRQVKATYVWGADFVRLALNKGTTGAKQRVDRPAS